MFIKEIIELESNYFNELSKSCKFTEICRGRKGAIVSAFTTSLKIPLVRCTTKFNDAVQKFEPIHYKLIQQINNILIQKKTKILDFNNALIEIYDVNYKSMKFHSDQSLDLDENSFICIFSCYEKQNSNRILEIKNKLTGKLTEIDLDNNSIILFNLVTNSKYLHKIKLKKNSKLDKIDSNQDKWLGVTFRLSKTYINFECQTPVLLNLNKELRLANEAEEKEFFNLKKRENNEINFPFPNIEYTISPGDLINII